MSVNLAALLQRDGLAVGRTRLSEGDAAGAAQAFRAIALTEPANYEARYWLYSALVASGAGEAAATALEEARLLHSVAALRALDVDMVRFQTDKAYCADVGVRAYSMK